MAHGRHRPRPSAVYNASNTQRKQTTDHQLPAPAQYGFLLCDEVSPEPASSWGLCCYAGALLPVCFDGTVLQPCQLLAGQGSTLAASDGPWEASATTIGCTHRGSRPSIVNCQRLPNMALCVVMGCLPSQHPAQLTQPQAAALQLATVWYVHVLQAADHGARIHSPERHGLTLISACPDSIGHGRHTR